MQGSRHDLCSTNHYEHPQGRAAVVLYSGVRCQHFGDEERGELLKPRLAIGASQGCRQECRISYLRAVLW